MPQAVTNVTNNASRRNVLRFSALATIAGLITPAIAAKPTPDAEILSLCAAFDGLEHEKQALANTITDDDEFALASDGIEVQQEPMVERLAELQATGIEAHRARASSLSLYLGEMQLQEDAVSDLWPNRLTAAILRDLATLPA